jgi:hypothetical protein
MRGPGKKTIEIRKAIEEILEDIQPASVRAVCYQLFVRKLIPDMAKNATNMVGTHLVALREEGTVPWEWVVDETRSVERVECWKDFEHHFNDFCDEHELDPWEDQPERVIIVSEKGTVRGTLQPILDELKVPLLVAHGYNSATAAYDLAQRSLDHDRPLKVLYVGDYDPSGMQMSEVDLPERLERYGGNAEITRVAIIRRDLSTLPDFSANDKFKNRNRPWYLRTYGERCVELDAMSPNDLRARVPDAILAHVAKEAWGESLERNLEEKDRLAERKEQILALLNGGAA